MKSLERQLQTSLTIIMLLILVGLVFVANLSTRSLLTKFVTAHLELDAERLLDSLEIQPSITKVRWRRLNPVYNTPNSGHYYAIQLNADNGKNQLIRSPSLNEESIPLPSNNTPTTQHDIAGPEGQHLIIWTKTFRKNNHNVIISIAEDMTLLMKNRKHFTILFIVIGMIGFMLMLALQRFVVRRLFKHLDYSRQEIKQVASGERQLLSEDVPTEIYPLVKEFNHSLSLMQQRMERSRNALGNLAHALKTPLSLLMQQLDNQDSEAAKGQAERIRQLTERELKRARMAGLGNTTQRFDPHEELATLISVIKQAHNKPELKVSLSIEEGVKQFGDREDMLELFGNLLDNACKWADSNVICRVKAGKTSNCTKITIEDDGQGRKEKELDQLTQRGVRIDESIEGHGLGLAICKDIVKLYAGSIEFSRSKNLGGFQVDVNL